MNAGNIFGIIILIGGFIFIKKYVKKRIKREVKIIDNISHPNYDTRNRNAASTRSIKTSGGAKSIGVKRKIEEGRGIQILKDSSGARGKSVNGKNSNSIELHKPTSL